MNIKKKAGLLVAALLLFFFFTPLYIYRARYEAKSNGQSIIYTGGKYSISEANYQNGGIHYRMGLNFFSRPGNRIKDLKYSSYSHLNLGLFSKFNILISVAVKEKNYITTKLTIYIHGLASNAEKRAYVINTVQGVLADERAKLRLAEKKR